MENRKKIKGIRSSFIFIPTMVIIGILYAFIIVATVFINKYSYASSTEMENTSLCLRYVSTMQGSSAKLSEVATAFCHMPIVGNPSVPESQKLNEDTIMVYADEIKDYTNTPEFVLEELKKYGVAENVINDVSMAAQNINIMKKTQARALYLVNSYLESKDLSISKYLENVDYTLTDEDNALSAEDKKELANTILSNLEYATTKGKVSDYLRDVNKNISINSSIKQSQINVSLKYSRGFLWGSIALILIANILFFAILLRKLVLPVIGFAKKIDENQRLDQTNGLYEAKYLAFSYNSLLDRHQELEDELREVAEFDSLTGLPNRYCYNEFLKKPIEDNKSVCVFLLDINNLKFINDTYGHSKGDELIKNASICIKECFLNEGGKNCYRIGGDEFVAILENIKEEDIPSYLEKFNKLQEELNVSIAIGYEYTDNILDIGYEKVIMSADNKMYENKNEKYKILNKNF